MKILLSLFLFSLSFAEQSGSLSESRNTLSTQGKKTFDDQISGVKPKPDPKKFVEVMDSTRRAQLAALLYPVPEDRKHLSFQELQFEKSPKTLLVGAWDSTRSKGEDHSWRYDQFSTFNMDKMALVEVASQGALRVQAVMDDPFENVDTILPTLSEDFDEYMYLYLPWDKIDRLDDKFVRYSKSQSGFSLTTVHHEGYAGGFAASEHSHLFMISGKKITRVLSTLIYNMSNLAGDWNEDGTRQRHTNEGIWKLSHTKKRKNGYYTFQLKGKKETIKMIWDPKKRRYRRSP